MLTDPSWPVPLIALLAAGLLGLALLLGACDRAQQEGPQPTRLYLPEIENMALVVLSTRVNEGPVIRPKACFVDKYEVTNGQYHAYLRDSGFWPAVDESFLAHWDDRGRGSARPREGEDELPVVFVNFQDALAYATHWGKQIPTREEWLAAAGVRPTRPYPWGDRFISEFFCNSLRAGIGRAVRVGTFESGKSPNNCYDMAGNVAEWTSSQYGEPIHPSHEKLHFVMGGSFTDWGHPKDEWKNREFDFLLTPDTEETDNRNFAVGFRCARSNAVPLVAELVERIGALASVERRSALLELAAAGRDMGPILRLLDFARRSRLVQRVAGYFKLEPLGNLDGEGGADFILEHRDGKLAAFADDWSPLWRAAPGYDRLLVIEDSFGLCKRAALLDKARNRLILWDSLQGRQKWAFVLPAEPREMVQWNTPDGVMIATAWTESGNGNGNGNGNEDENENGTEDNGDSGDQESAARTFLTCHRAETGELLWQVALSGTFADCELVPPAGTSAEDGEDGALLVVVVEESTERTAFHLLTRSDGSTLTMATLPGERMVNLYPGGFGGAVFLGFAERPQVLKKSMEQIEAASAPFLGPVGRFVLKQTLDLCSGRSAGKILVEVRVAKPLALNVTAFHLGAWVFSRPKATFEAYGPEGSIDEARAREACRRYLEQEFHIKQVVCRNDGSVTWILTELDRNGRIALVPVSLQGDPMGLVLLQGVLGSGYRNSWSRESAGGRGDDAIGGDDPLLLWTNGGHLICFEQDQSRLRWWRHIPLYSSQAPLIAALTRDEDRKIFLYSLYGQIALLDFATGQIGMMLMKTGAELADLDVLDADGDGEAEIFACFKDEGVYRIYRRPLQKHNALDVVLVEMEQMGLL